VGDYEGSKEVDSRQLKVESEEKERRNAETQGTRRSAEGEYPADTDLEDGSLFDILVHQSGSNWGRSTFAELVIELSWGGMRI
jgi:hypothetical protein